MFSSLTGPKQSLFDYLKYLIVRFARKRWEVLAPSLSKTYYFTFTMKVHRMETARLSRAQHNTATPASHRMVKGLLLLEPCHWKDGADMICL